MRIVVLGDLHFYQLAVWPWQLFSKRLLGQTNLWLNRRRHFRPELWPMVRDQVIERAPDLLLCSGDFTTTALPGEFEIARNAWRELVDAVKPALGAYVVPGNHDRYTYGASRQRLFEAAFGEWTSQEWPAKWTLDPQTHLIGLDPTRPNRFNASGALGEQQLAGLAKLLNEFPVSHQILILCHYPVGTPCHLPDEAPGHGLQDTDALIQVLSQSNRPLTYIHGHVHWPWHWHPSGTNNVTAINAGAPLLMGNRYPRGQGFLELESIGEGSPLKASRQSVDAEGGWYLDSVR